jgi:HlyD family secretion protein
MQVEDDVQEGRWRRTRRGRVTLAVIAVSGVVLALLVTATLRRRRFARLPVTTVHHSVFIEYLEARGRIQSMQSLILTAPGGVGDLRILKIVANGARVKKGDVLVEFDASTIKQKRDQDRSTVRAGEAEIEKSTAAARLKEEQTLTESLKSKFDVESARMDASKEEIMSPIDGAKARNKVADAEQAHNESEVKLQAYRSAGAADLEGKRLKRDEARYTLKQDDTALATLSMRSPLDGTIIVRDNLRAARGTSPPEPFRAGDQAWPGAQLIEIPDPHGLIVEGRIEEADRGRAQVGQHVVIRLDAVPDQDFSGKVDQISPTASIDFAGGWPFRRNFTMRVSIADRDAPMTPGMNASCKTEVDRIGNAISVPETAVFKLAGRNVVYVRRGWDFRAVPVEVNRRSSGQALIEGQLADGDLLSLEDPDAHTN